MCIEEDTNVCTKGESTCLNNSYNLIRTKAKMLEWHN